MERVGLNDFTGCQTPLGHPHFTKKGVTENLLIYLWTSHDSPV